MSEAQGWVGHRLDGRDGNGVGRIVGVLGDDDAPRLLVVRTGRLGRVTAIPGAQAVEGSGCVWVPYERDLIRGAPKLDSREELDADAERRLRGHYGVG